MTWTTSRAPAKPQARAPDDVAFIQFSSGSTSEPKGVVLTHAQHPRQLRGATEAARASPSATCSLSWMPLTHDMGLIGFHIYHVRQSHRTTHLMPTELFVRRPLLWLQLAAAHPRDASCARPTSATGTTSRCWASARSTALDLSAVRLIFNGAEPISVELCDEFLDAARAVRACTRTAMFPVYGLAEASLAVSFPARRARASRRSALRPSPAERRRRGRARSPAGDAQRDALVSRRPARSRTARCASRRTTTARLPGGRVGHVQIRGDNVTSGYYDDAGGQRRARSPPTAGCDTGDLGVDASTATFTSPGAPRKSFSSTARTTTRTTSRPSRSAPTASSSARSWRRACGRRGAETERAGGVRPASRRHGGFPAARRAKWPASSTSRPASRSAHVVPVKRIPKTTSGKIQRICWRRAIVDGEFAAELAELARAARRAARTRSPARATAIEEQLKASAMRRCAGKRVDVARQPVRDRRQLAEADRDPRADRPRVSRAWWT